jgi:hypothetical protein
VIGVVYLINLVDLMALPGIGSTYVDQDMSALAYDKNMNGVLDLTWQTPSAQDIEWTTARVRFHESVDFALRLITVPGVRRIEAQKAVFLRLGRLRIPTPSVADVNNARAVWKILRLVAQKWCFFHTAGPYSEPSEGIERQQLMPADDAVDRLVAAQRAAEAAVETGEAPITAL